MSKGPSTQLQQSKDQRPKRPIPTRKQPGNQATAEVLGTERRPIGRLEKTLSDLSLGESSAAPKHHQEDLEVFLFMLK